MEYISIILTFIILTGWAVSVVWLLGMMVGDSE